MINIPFNFQPESVSVQSTNYTVPVGKFAYIVAQVRDGATFRIDGNDSLTSRSVVSADNISVDLALGSYTVPTGYRFHGQVNSSGGSAVVSVGGENAINLDNTEDFAFSAGEGDIITKASGTGTVVLTGYSFRDPESGSSFTEGFWLPSGTEISGSGTWRATVMIYSSIS